MKETFFCGSLYNAKNINFVFDNVFDQNFFETNLIFSNTGTTNIACCMFTLSDNNAISSPSTSLFTCQYLVAMEGPVIVFSYEAYTQVVKSALRATDIIFIARDISSCVYNGIDTPIDMSLCDMVVFPNEPFKFSFEQNVSKSFRNHMIKVPRSIEDYKELINETANIKKNKNDRSSC